MINDTCEKIRCVLKEQLSDDLFVDAGNIGIEEELFSLGVDSLNIIKIIMKLEDLYQIDFEDDDLHIDNLKTMASIAGLIESKVGL